MSPGVKVSHRAARVIARAEIERMIDHMILTYA
jgi:hypothetical protein